MTTPLQPAAPERDAAIASAAFALAAAWAQLHRAQLETIRALELQRADRARGAIQRVRRTLQTFTTAVAVFDRAARAVAERWAAQDLPLLYRSGATLALARALRHLPLDHRSFTWTDRHQAAITSLSARYYTDLITRIQETVRRAQAFTRTAQVQARTTAGVDRRALLDRHGLDTVVYRNAAKHPVDAWARAALGQQATTTVNTAALTLGRYDLDAHWFECIDGSECGFTGHNDLDKANGTIRSAEDAETWPIAHFGCIRQWIPRPDLTTAPGLESGADL
ncbi:hypothetical protein [Streptomyces showdoensis]|uniref:hypothetical protein n=1 Tax=Streptomyces showdoensis TaxID=68268 RepID=UPI000F503BF1|nr:hypothetical protein [Streptomyces showdoensis]